MLRLFLELLMAGLLSTASGFLPRASSLQPIRAGRACIGTGKELRAKKGRFDPPAPSPTPSPEGILSGGDSNSAGEASGDLESGYAFEIELPKRAGIDWGADLSFSWVYVLGK